MPLFDLAYFKERCDRLEKEIENLHAEIHFLERELDDFRLEAYSSDLTKDSDVRSLN